jgi:hypothetical protein
MKKLMILSVLLMAANSFIFSLEEAWISVGANFGNYFENGTGLENAYMGYAGVNFNGYGFWNKKNIGLFYNVGVLFPITDTIESNYNPIVLGDFILGPGFRYNFSEKLKLRFGIGFNLNYFSFLDRINNDKKFSDHRIGLGIGGDMGIKYDLTDSFYLDFGIALTYDFANYRWIQSTGDNWKNTKQETSGWINNYSMFGIRPYISIGINMYQEKAHTGKPKD